MDDSGRHISSEPPQAPWPHPKAGINLKWHHVIPFPTLRDCWEALAANLDQGRCRVAIESYLRLLKVETSRGWVKEMAAKKLSFERGQVLERRIVWPAWNSVEGPAFRTDDPGSNLDEFTAGLTAPERNRQERIKELFIEMRRFNPASAGETMSESSVEAVVIVMNQVERTLVAGDAIHFRAAMWMETSEPAKIPRGAANVRWWKKTSGHAPYERQ